MSKGKKQPYYIQLADQALLGMAGLWEVWESGDGSYIESCTILTTQPNKLIHTIHHRMPLILEPDDWPLWLGEAGKGAARLMQPGAEAVLTFHRVDPAVNSNRASGPELIEPIT